MTITLTQASTLVDAALAEARKLALKPIAVAVLDPGGHLVAYKREDESSIARFNIAFGKAWATLGMGFGGRTLAERATKAPVFFAALMAASDGRMVPARGGVLIRDAAGALVGAVGITGDTSEQDEACALAGIAAAGLVADPGAAAG
jgi:uncharacterized protein GlcG (DUF336 family)